MFNRKFKPKSVEGFLDITGKIHETKQKALEASLTEEIEKALGTHKLYSWTVSKDPLPLYKILKKYCEKT